MAAADVGALEPVRVFFDADVILNAAFSSQDDSASIVLLQLSELGLLEGITSEKAQEEALRNCESKLPQALPKLRDFIANSLVIWREPADEHRRDAAEHSHEKDTEHLVTALDAGYRFLLTRNLRDFRLPADAPLEVIDPGGFIRRIRQALAAL